VYGDFDLDNNGQASAQDAAVIKRLVSQWGGTLVPIANPEKPADSISVDVDFIVMGLEPVVPPKDETVTDPIIIAQIQKATEDQKRYLDVRERAAQLGIPIMNQNRFLYYTGYFDQARR